jgi:hypothetical protein
MSRPCKCCDLLQTSREASHKAYSKAQRALSDCVRSHSDIPKLIDAEKTYTDAFRFKKSKKEIALKKSKRDKFYCQCCKLIIITLNSAFKAYLEAGDAKECCENSH